jgi:hypothetical protein
MSEIDQPHHAEDERDAERAQGKEAAEAERIEDDLENGGHLSAP